MGDAWPSVPEFPFFLAFFRIIFRAKSLIKHEIMLNIWTQLWRRLLPAREQSTPTTTKSSTEAFANQ